MHIKKIRKQFPILSQKVHGHPLAYLDNAATTQKPLAVINAMRDFYYKDNAAVHRGVHYLSEQATSLYEAGRAKVQGFINAGSSNEIVFTRSTTEAINLVASSYLRHGAGKLQADDAVIISTMEHHSNILPWQFVCDAVGAQLRVIGMHNDGTLDLENYARLLDARVKLVAITHASNVLGTINPVKQMIEAAHKLKIPVLIDGAQAVPHLKVDVRDLDCDFYAFSGHKMYAPLGVGVLYGKYELLQQMPPYQGGGGIIKKVSFTGNEYLEAPHRFEAGTYDAAAVVGLSAAIDYLHTLGMDNIKCYEDELMQYALDKMQQIPGLQIVGNPNAKSDKRVSVISFVMQDAHAHDVGTILDSVGVAVRVGHHCAMPLMDRLGIPATTRVSIGLYNTEKEVEQLMVGISEVKRIFK